jgi:hypothetical protein
MIQTFSNIKLQLTKLGLSGMILTSNKIFHVEDITDIVLIAILKGKVSLEVL